MFSGLFPDCQRNMGTKTCGGEARDPKWGPHGNKFGCTRILRPRLRMRTCRKGERRVCVCVYVCASASGGSVVQGRRRGAKHACMHHDSCVCVLRLSSLCSTERGLNAMETKHKWERQEKRGHVRPKGRAYGDLWLRLLPQADGHGASAKKTLNDQIWSWSHGWWCNISC